MADDSGTRWALVDVWRTAGYGCCGVAVAVSCSGSPDVPVSNGAPRADVVAPPVGVADRGDDPAVVALDVGEAQPCAGVLVATDIVLTALHCVALFDGAVDCGEAGAGAAQLLLRSPDTLRVLLGDDMATATLRARGRQILAPPGARLCGADLAFVLLDQPIDDVEPLTVRPTGAALGDHVRTVGFGSVGPSTAKLLRDHVAVVGTSPTELEIAESALDEGGGPALDETTAEILGVVSRNDGAPSRDVYTRADAFASFVASALAMSESATPSSTGTAKPKKGPADMGANCASGSDCAAGVCVSAAGGAERYCSRSCGVADRCPTLFGCERSQSGDEVCVQK